MGARTPTARRSPRLPTPPPAARAGRKGLRAAPLLAGLLLAAPQAPAAPLDLDDPTPRRIEVAFEVSPQDAPGSLRSRFTAPLPARFEPTADPDQVRVVVSGPVVEAHLLRHYDPIPGSFSDFVWVFDRRTGHVVSAALRGTVLRAADLGIAVASVRTEVRVEMTSESSAGYRDVFRVLGHEMYPYCEAAGSGRRGDCTVVQGEALDPASGYVNAVGEIAARTGLVRIRAFSPLGEALFRERASPVDEQLHVLQPVSAPGPAVRFPR